MNKSKVILLDKEFHLGLGFLNELVSGTGLSLVDLGTEIQINSTKFVPEMMFYSLKYAAFRNNQPFELTIHDIYDMIDNNGGKDGSFWNSFLIAFQTAMTKDVPKDDKKKVKKPE